MENTIRVKVLTTLTYKKEKIFEGAVIDMDRNDYARIAKNGFVEPIYDDKLYTVSQKQAEWESVVKTYKESIRQKQGVIEELKKQIATLNLTIKNQDNMLTAADKQKKTVKLIELDKKNIPIKKQIKGKK